MSIDFFGWLTKSKYEVSALDRLIGLVELIFIIVCIFSAWILFDFIKLKFKERKSK